MGAFVVNSALVSEAGRRKEAQREETIQNARARSEHEDIAVIESRS
jgi:hypothetical protein